MINPTVGYHLDRLLEQHRDIDKKDFVSKAVYEAIQKARENYRMEQLRNAEISNSPQGREEYH